MLWVLVEFPADRLDALRAMEGPPTRIRRLASGALVAGWELAGNGPARSGVHWPVSKLWAETFGGSVPVLPITGEIIFDGGPVWSGSLYRSRDDSLDDSKAELAGGTQPVPERFEQLLFWCRERENIRLKRAAGLPAPWTDDPILGKYSFCNLRRENDRGTIFVREQIRERFAGHPALWFMLCVARWVNKTTTLARLIETPGCWPSDPDFDLDTAGELVQAMVERREKPFGAAYIIPTGAGAKAPQIFRKFLPSIWNRREEFEAMFARGARLQAVHAMLMQGDHFGQFLSYQIIVDLSYTPLLENASDRETWAACGPGTLQGLNLVMGRPAKARLSQAGGRYELRKMDALLRQHLPEITWRFSDTPNIFCEYSKYIKALTSPEMPKRLYKPGGTIRPAARPGNAQRVIAAFDRLPEAERAAVMTALAERVAK